MNKDLIVAEVRERLQQLKAEFSGWTGAGLCLPTAAFTCHILKRHGVKCCLQAGSMSWPIVRPHEDDGVSPTHLSYIWSPDEPASRNAMKMGLLPEMHCWVGIPSTQEIIDLSTRGFTEATHLLGMQWRSDSPPDYVWGRELPDWVIYKPDRSATLFAMYKSTELRHWIARKETDGSKSVGAK